jgi:hypothetical protein
MLFLQVRSLANSEDSLSLGNDWCSHALLHLYGAQIASASPD